MSTKSFIVAVYIFAAAFTGGASYLLNHTNNDGCPAAYVGDCNDLN